jgi:N-acyl-phosphatidylethanolamine-hydrolysing phospholipase D
MAQPVIKTISSKLKAHHVKGGFQNIWDSCAEPSLFKALRWGLNRKLAPMPDLKTLDGTIPVVKPDLDMIRNPPKDGIQVTWIGHATCLVQMDGLNILTDPVWSEKASPSQLVGAARYRKVPCGIADLPPIDAVCISHNHYDHLDYHTVLALGNKPKWFVPLGLKSWFAGVNISNVVELDWWEEFQFTPAVRVAATPAQHWSARLPPFDTNKTLWAGWYACMLVLTLGSVVLKPNPRAGL